ncbi:MAG: glycosyltransferase family 9 protein [Bacteroidales bacterium]|nr:glycosyltransferase family 9 protein [Bacteroidales bacterium]
MELMKLHKILIIQTAFIGDVVLATPLIEALHDKYPDATIDFLLRKGNEGLLINHPKLNQVLIWDKRGQKTKNLLHIISKVRREQYDAVFNAQRFFSSGLITARSGVKYTAGFDKNPLSFTFTKKIAHHISEVGTMHETERNLQLLSDFIENPKVKMKLYPQERDFKRVKTYKTEPYLVIAASSVWFTKQYPVSKWVELLAALKNKYKIYFIGGTGDLSQADEIIRKSKAANCVNLCGELNMLESAALMQDAKMNYVNDSAPLHFASAVNAAVSAVYCSTVPAFGFGPISTNSHIIEIDHKLDCRPCGLHGKNECPEGHYKCAIEINTEQLTRVLEK